LVHDSFVPDGNIQSLRQYGRRINEINEDLVHCQQRIDMILQRCNIRLSNYVSNTDTKSYRKVIDAFIKGETSSYELVKLIQGRTINSHGQSTIREALEGDVKQSDRDLLRQYTRMNQKVGYFLVLSFYRFKNQVQNVALFFMFCLLFLFLFQEIVYGLSGKNSVFVLWLLLSKCIKQGRIFVFKTIYNKKYQLLFE